MKPLFTALLVSTLTCGAAIAAPLTLTITGMQQKELDPGSFGPDKCTVIGTVKNGADDTLQIFMQLFPDYEEGSASAMIAPAGNSFGNIDSLAYLDMAAGSEESTDVGILGALCGEITAITVKPLCKNVQFVEIPCPVGVVLSPDSIVPVRLEGSEETFGETPFGPEGSMHGNWEIRNKSGAIIGTLALIHPLERDITGSFALDPALCALEKQGSACADGSSGGERLQYASNSNGKVTIGMDTSDGGRVTFLWNYETGEGKVVNQRGSMNAPITATRVE
jgi:hypothetical protein